MSAKRKVEIFSAGCPACKDAVELVRRAACRSCEVTILDMNDPAIASRAKVLGVRSVPSLVVDGKLLSCCRTGGLTKGALREAGIGVPL